MSMDDGGTLKDGNAVEAVKWREVLDAFDLQDGRVSVRSSASLTPF